ncbi:hypothetical protein AVEN_44268-1 [Araneus ventricosus]|uniref:Uncharacterized protein n=1 Tax=Araneus ventricosus TaxID=182803 RepID=A0A4Y2W297_ARAVE|nr:hypothetical protein AVEN_44268-1 [Araneus ventricosus]
MVNFKNPEIIHICSKKENFEREEKLIVKVRKPVKFGQTDSENGNLKRTEAVYSIHSYGGNLGLEENIYRQGRETTQFGAN